jgi:hypothetical protein
MKKKYLFSQLNVFVCFLCFCSCNIKIELNSNIEIIYAKSNIKESASNIFEHIKVIPLETTDSSLIGRLIDRIEICNGKIFIQNYLGSHTNIVCFDLSGKFLFNIDKMGQGPEEYAYLGDFFIDKNLQHLVFISENRRFIHFDLNGIFLYDIYSDDFYLARQSIYLNDSTYLMLNDVSEPVIGFKGFSLLYIDAATMNVRHKTNSISEFYYIGNKPLSKYGDRVLCHTINDSIFDISDSVNVKTAYYFYYTNIQAKNTEKFRKNFNKMDDMERVRYAKEPYYSGKSIFINTMYENSKYLIFGCMRIIPYTDKSIKYILFYDKKTKKVYDSDNINFDGFVFKNVAVLGVYDESLYCVLYSEITDEDKEKIRKSKAFSNEDKKTIIEHKFDDNPLLFILK